MLWQEHGQGHSEEVPGTVFTWLYYLWKDEPALKNFNFNEKTNHYGQIWFEALCFSILLVVILSIIAIAVSRKTDKVPRGMQNFFEMLIDMLTKMLTGLVGPEVKKFMPYLFTLFIYIFCMNLAGLIPAFRSPTINISTTAALGIITFFAIQGVGIKHNGPIGYFFHFTGKNPFSNVWAALFYWILLAPLMLVIHVVGEIAKPVSLSARLFGNMFADEKGVENLMELGHGIPLQTPLLLFGVLVCMIQAIVFTTLTAFYLKLMVAHDEEH